MDRARFAAAVTVLSLIFAPICSAAFDGGLSEGTSPPFELYLGPGFAPPASGSIASAVSAPFELHLGPGFGFRGGSGTASALSAAFDVYLGPGFRAPAGAGTGSAVSLAFDLYLGHIRETYAGSGPFEIDTRAPDPTFVQPPANLTAALGSCGSEVELHWTEAATDPTGFQVDAKVRGFPNIWYERIATLGPSARSLLHVTSDGLARTYRVRAVRGTALSLYSNEASVSAPALPGLAQPPTGLIVKSIGDGTGLRVHIKPPQGSVQWDVASLVQIEQSTSLDFDHDVIDTKRVGFSGSGGKTIRFEGERDRPYYFRAQIDPPCSPPSVFTTTSRAIAPRYAPVLLVHGIWEKTDVWGQVWLDVLAGAGFSPDRIRRADFSFCGDTWMNWGEELRTEIMPAMFDDGGDWQDDECADLITHSQGGLASRYYVEWRGGAPTVRTLVMINTPNHGGEFATFGSFLHNLGLSGTACLPISNSIGVRALGSNATPLRKLNFGNDWQHDGMCEETPREQFPSKKGSVEYYTIAGTGPSALYCNPLLYIYCQLHGFKDEDPGDCASDGVVKVQSVYLRALPASHQFEDMDLGAGGTVHAPRLAVPNVSQASLESNEIAEWAVGLLRRPNTHDAGSSPPQPADPAVSRDPERAVVSAPNRTHATSDSVVWLASTTDSLGWGSGANTSFAVTVEPMDQLMVVGTWHDSTMTLTLRSPDQTLYTPADTLGRPWLHFEHSDAIGYGAFAVDSPMPGTWRAEISMSPSGIVKHFDVDWMAKGIGASLVGAVDPDVTNPGDSILVSATFPGTPAVPAHCRAAIERPDGTVDSLLLQDDGVAPDAVGGDGVHSGRYVAPVIDGEYRVRLAGTPNEVSAGSRTARASFTVVSGPDVKCSDEDTHAAPPFSAVGRLTEVVATLHNHGFLDADSIRVVFEDESGGETLGTSIVRVSGRDSAVARTLWTPQTGGEHRVLVTATLLGGNENDVSNNSAAVVVPVAAAPPTTGVDTVLVVPGVFDFSPPRPNPFRNSVSLDFALPRRARVSIEVFDPQGRRVKRVLDEVLPAGRHTRFWSGEDASGHPSRPGVFFVRFEVPGHIRTRKAVLLR